MVARAVTYKFTVAEYNRMAEAGILREDDRVELIEGEIVRMSAIGNRHLGAVNRLNALFASLAINRRAVVSVQNPVIIGQYSEPEPDGVLLRFTDTFYGDRTPVAEDVLLLIEVADSSVDYDRLTKMAVYARAGVPEAWLVDLTQDRIELYRGPAGGAFGEPTIFRRGDTLAPAAFPDMRAKVEDIIG